MSYFAKVRVSLKYMMATIDTISNHPQLSEQTKSLISTALNSFEENFSKEPCAVALAPGRVNLIGEHIDYCDGFVLPMAIDRYIVFVTAPNDDNVIRCIDASLLGEPAVEIPIDCDLEISTPKWANYLRGVVDGYFKKGMVPKSGFDVFITSNVPKGGGLSSSAALEMAMAFALKVNGAEDSQSVSTEQRALISQHAEHTFAGVPCGIMDQFASAFGQKDQLTLIDCRSQDVELVPFTDESLSIVIANTNVSHELNDGEYASRRQQTEDGLRILAKPSWRDVSLDEVVASKEQMDELTYKRSVHVVGEISRTIQAAEALKANNSKKFGELMKSSHQSLRDDFEVSCPELDTMVDIALELADKYGVLGSRMTGGGFGGSTVSLVASQNVDSFIDELSSLYQQATGITPEIFASRPATGAQAIGM